MSDLVVVDWTKLPTKREIQSQLNRINLPADAKAALFRISDATYRVENRVIDIGRRILAFVLELFKHFPNLTVAVLAALVISALVSSVAVLGSVLGALLGPLIVAAGVGIGTLAEMREGRLAESVDWLSRELEGLIL